MFGRPKSESQEKFLSRIVVNERGGIVSKYS